MNKNTITKLKTSFDALQQTVPESDVEFWYARELMPELGYDRWENFSKVIKKAAEACKTVGASVDNHFRGVTKMVSIGSGAERAMQDIVLTRYACYQFTVSEVDSMVSQNVIPYRKHLERRFQMLCSCLKNFKPQRAQSSQRGNLKRPVGFQYDN